MRQIETRMLAALAAGQDWRERNTVVTADRTVTLHGHRIAYHNGQRMVVDIGTLQDWPTVTTKSRLRALGFDVEQRKGAIYLDGRHVGNI